MDGSRYEETHPWLTFQLDLSHCTPRFWMLLGEIRSKCDHIRFVPLAEDTAAELMRVYFAKGVNATTAIEGNTLTEEQVRERLDGQLELPVSKEYLGREIDNMVRCYNDILHASQRGEHIRIGKSTLERLNAEILKGLEPEGPHDTPGIIRKDSVTAGPYLAPPAQCVDELVERLCQWLEDEFQVPSDDQRTPIAFIKAVVAHVYLEWIHPFGNGNGRLGRLIEFLVLIRSGVPAPAAHLLTSHYNDTRTQYYRELHEASRNGGDLRGFLLYAAQGLVDGLGEAIKRLHKQQEVLMWHALLDEAFIGRHTQAAERQRQLAIAIGRQDGWTPKTRTWRLSDELSDLYGNKTTKTLTRDLNRLIQMGFVTQRGNAVRANLARVRGMRPFAVDPIDASDGPGEGT